ncbi:uncharacterized protein LOC115755815 [Rhodamnia argentea]|uniref:Uncharacterized protein LOC115755815 n=1 Tax=Rhodamnia argentea TaxID=178133 RepID=A0A8B8QY16_9MYRT|nr:uncharacterized protein LOC115755815 [Rhodamnia argentea]
MIGVRVMMNPPSTNAHDQWNLLRRHSLHYTTRTTLPRSRATPARDRVIDFGRHKGKMLGTLPSSYLRWVCNNLRARDTEEWAQLAEQVLQDPVYRDRMEWESAERVLNGGGAGGGPGSAVPELLEISERFGWDNEDKAAWGRVDFKLLGTSKGGRIPRKSDDGKEKGKGKGKEEYSESESPSQGEERRRERRHRLRSKRESGEGQNRTTHGGSRREVRNGGAEAVPEPIYNPFPGRESLLRKVLNGKGPQ